MGALSQFKGLPKQVYYLSAIRVIMALGSLVFPFLIKFTASIAVSME